MKFSGRYTKFAAGALTLIAVMTVYCLFSETLGFSQGKISAELALAESAGTEDMESGNEVETEVEAAEEVKLTLLHTNDEHSEVIPHTPVLDFGSNFENSEKRGDKSRGGMTRLARAVNDIRRECAESGRPVLLFSGGDIIGGTPFSWLASEGRAAELNLMQDIGYDGIVIGNHEFDYGVDVLKKYLQDAGYPEAHNKTAFLASNIEPGGEEKFADYYRQEEIIFLAEKRRELQEIQSQSEKGLKYLRDEIAGEKEAKTEGNTKGIVKTYDSDGSGNSDDNDDIKVAVFGLIGEQAFSIAPDTGELEFRDPADTARELVDEFEDRGAHITIALTHAGLEEDKELAEEVEGLDIIVGGHSHDVLASPKRAGDTYIVQAGAYLEKLGRMDISLNPETDEIFIDNYELIDLDRDIPPCPEISERVDGYIEELNELMLDVSGGQIEDVKSPVLRSDFSLKKEPYTGENSMGNFVTDAMRFEAQRELGEEVHIAFQGNGQIRGEIFPGGSKGEITYYDLISPVSLGKDPEDNFGFPLVTAHLKGEEVETLLEVAAFIPQVESDKHFMHFSGLRYSFDPDNAVLFTLPFVDVPVIPLRAVEKAELYTGEGLQTEEDGDFEEFAEDKLYRLVTDSHMLSQISLVESIIPWIDLTPRDEEGNPLDFDNMENFFVSDADEEGNLKVWQALINYIEKFNQVDREEEDIPKIPAYYAFTHGRINTVDAASLRLKVIILIAITALAFLILYRRGKPALKSALESLKSGF